MRMIVLTRYRLWSTILLALLLPLIVVAQSATLSLATDDAFATYTSGDEITLRVQIDTADPVFSGDVQISFNPGLLEMLRISEGDFFTGGVILAQDIDNIAGQLRYSYSLLGNAEQPSGLGTFVRITFRALGEGDARISVRRATFSSISLDEDGLPSPSTPVPVNLAETLISIRAASESGAADPVPQVIEPEPATLQAATPEPATPQASTGIEPTLAAAPETLEMLPDIVTVNDNTNDWILLVVLFVLVVALVTFIVFVSHYLKGQRKAVHAQLKPMSAESGRKPHLIRDRRCVITRDKMVGTSLTIADKRISNPHALILHQGVRKYYIRDLKSANGTFIHDLVDGSYKRLEPGVTYRLNDGDQIRFGQEIGFRFEMLPRIAETVREGQIMRPFETRIEPSMNESN